MPKQDKELQADKVLIYTDAEGDFRWKRIASNGSVISKSFTGFFDKRNCLRNFNRSLNHNFYIKGYGLDIKGKDFQESDESND